MIRPTRTFIHYHQSPRRKRTVIGFVATFAVSGLAFAIAVFSIINSPDQPTAMAIAALPVGVVCFTIGCSLLWFFATGRVHEVHVTDEGVICDGTYWPWESVVSIRSTPVSPNGAAYLSIATKRRFLRSHLTLLIEVRDNEPLETINELRRFLADAGHTIPWRSRAA